MVFFLSLTVPTDLFEKVLIFHDSLGAPNNHLQEVLIFVTYAGSQLTFLDTTPEEIRIQSDRLFPWQTNRHFPFTYRYKTSHSGADCDERAAKKIRICTSLPRALRAIWLREAHLRFDKVKGVEVMGDSL